MDLSDAIASGSTHAEPFILGIRQEEIDEELKKCEKVLEGEFRGGEQEHLYMEPQCAVVVPGESDELTIYASTQAISWVHHQAAAVVGIPANNVVVKTKRLGGGFGGKLAQSLFPVVFGLAARADALLYKIPKIHSEGHCMKTHKSSSTAFRGYGVPQNNLVMEYLMNRIAHEVDRPLTEIKELNMSKQFDRTFNNNVICNDALVECWNTCKKQVDYEARMRAIVEFNSRNHYVKRGGAMAATRLGLTLGPAFEQASALVQILLDGSVSVSIGGTEMGQGLNSKMLQIASRALVIPIDRISILDASTDKTANAPDTGGSQNTDLHGLAVLKCCERLMEGLKPIRHHEKDWNAAVLIAYNRHVQLQASEHITIDRSRLPFPDQVATYHTSGVAYVEVEVDTMTGEHQLLSVDIVMDVGEGINPAVDIGQIEGAFTQGYGWLTCEELTFDEVYGSRVQDRMHKYKVPTAQMVPRKFNVNLIRAGKNGASQIYSSKGIGEPPLVLDCAVYSALRDVIANVRREKGRREFVQIDAPLTAEKILRYCST